MSKKYPNHNQAYADYGPLADLACALDYLHAATDAPSIAPMCRGHGSPQFFKSVVRPSLSAFHHEGGGNHTDANLILMILY
jgi:hypothetical protein